MLTFIFDFWSLTKGCLLHFALRDFLSETEMSMKLLLCRLADWRTSSCSVLRRRATEPTRWRSRRTTGATSRHAPTALSTPLSTRQRSAPRRRSSSPSSTARSSSSGQCEFVAHLRQRVLTRTNQRKINLGLCLCRCDFGFVGFKTSGNPRLECNKSTCTEFTFVEHSDDNASYFLKGTWAQTSIQDRIHP